jgi:iron complex transport system substrate-binding protein
MFRLSLFAISSLLGVSACSGAQPPPADGAIVDDLGRTVTVATPPRRIVALVPSATDLILALGESDRLVARTRYDTDPRLAALPTVGGGLDPNIEAIIGLRPDLVIAWPGAEQPIIGHLEAAGIAVYGAGSQSLEDQERHTRQIGRLLGVEPKADSLLAHIDSSFAALAAALDGVPEVSALYVAWHDPPMTTGPGTFVDSIMSVAGGRNIFDDATADWPQVNMEEIVTRDPDVLILPVPDVRDSVTIAWVHLTPGWRDLRAVRTGKILLVDSELFSRPGPRIIDAAIQLAELLHPGMTGP